MKSKIFPIIAALLLATPIFAQRNTVLKFSHSTSKIVVPHAPDLNLSTDFTIEAWLYIIDHVNSFNTVVEKTDFLYGLYLTREGNAQGWLATPNSSGDMTSVKILPSNEWLHLAMTYEIKTGVLRVWLNGKSEGATSIKPPEAPATSTTDLIIGGATNSTGGFHGYMDEVRISRSIRYKTDSDPKSFFNNDTNTVALWHFDEGSGTTVSDASGKDHTGTLTDVTFATLPVSTGIRTPIDAPLAFSLSPASPNPFSSFTSLTIDGVDELPASATLKIYDNLGQEIYDLSDQVRSGSKHIAVLGSMLPKNGMYYCILRHGQHTITRAITMIR